MENLKDLVDDLQVSDKDEECYESLEAYFIDQCRDG